LTQRAAHGPIGSTLEDFLRDEGMLEEATEHAIKSVIAWQLQQAMKERRLTKKRMAEQLGTSPEQIDKLLDPANEGVTLETLKRAANLLGKKLRIDLVDAV
jgi:antitoxin HicB